MSCLRWEIRINDVPIMSLRIGAEVTYQPGKINPQYAGLRYPQPGDEGTFTIGCSCRRWSFTGTAAECIRAGQMHDDNPFKQHVVSVVSRAIPE
jgi:hypothetical protein